MLRRCRKNVAAARYFGVAAEAHDVGGGGVVHLRRFAADRALAAVEGLAEAHGAAGGFHGLLAVVAAHDVHAGGADIERALFDGHVAAECGGTVFLVEFALVGFDFDGLFAVA